MTEHIYFNFSIETGAAKKETATTPITVFILIVIAITGIQKLHFCKTTNSLHSYNNAARIFLLRDDIHKMLFVDCDLRKLLSLNFYRIIP
jgi:hypothetical protein